MLGYGGIDFPVISERTALTLSAVYRAVTLIAGSIASLPLRTVVEGKNGLRKTSSSFLDSPGLDRLTPFEWKELVCTYLLLHGAAPLQHIFNGRGQVVGLMPIHPLAVGVELDNARPGGRLFKVRLPGRDASADYVEFDATTMTYVMGPSVDGIRGISPITAARQSMGTSLSTERAANRVVANGMMSSGIITPGDDMDLTEKDAQTVKEAVNRSVGGPENAGDVAVFTRSLKFQPWSMSMADAQFLESRKFGIDEIGRWYGVPPHLLGQVDKSTSWGTGIEEQNRGLHRYTLATWTQRIEARLSDLIPAARKVEFDYSQFLQPSPSDEIALLIEQVNSGIITPNESRAIRNLPPVPGGDTLRVPAGAANPQAAPGSPSGTGGPKR